MQQTQRWNVPCIRIFGLVECNATTSAITSVSGDADTGITLIRFHFVPDGQSTEISPYAWVQITKDQIGTLNDNTTIEALGYNTFDQNSVKRVERALKVDY